MAYPTEFVMLVLKYKRMHIDYDIRDEAFTIFENVLINYCIRFRKLAKILLIIHFVVCLSNVTIMRVNSS